MSTIVSDHHFVSINGCSSRRLGYDFPLSDKCAGWRKGALAPCPPFLLRLKLVGTLRLNPPVETARSDRVLARYGASTPCAPRLSRPCLGRPRSTSASEASCSAGRS